MAKEGVIKMKSFLNLQFYVPFSNFRELHTKFGNVTINPLNPVAIEM